MESGYRCPKCRSTDYYEGTITVSKQSGSFGAFDPDKGVGFIRPVSSSSEETVTRCKKCDTQLGKKDYYEHYTPAERSAKEDERVARDLRAKRNDIIWWIVIVVLFIGWYFFGL